MPDKINRLCELAGILPDYYDIWGGRHEATEATKHALLTAMGFKDATETDLDARIGRIEAAAWQETLPPVQIAQTGQPTEVTWRPSEQEAGLVHTWQLTLEDGSTLTGQARAADLPQSGSHTVGDKTAIAVRLTLPALDRLGYHNLTIGLGDDVSASCMFINCPATAYTPPFFANGNRIWGLAIQLYGVRTRRNWGLGDYADLRLALDWAADSGASLIGLNPLHALFPHNPQHCSPYSPSSRQFNNVLRISVEAIPEFAECVEARDRASTPAFQARLDELRKAEFVDYQGVADTKYPVLAMLFSHFRSRHLANGTARAQAFLDYRKQGGEDLRLFALYHAMQDHFFNLDNALWGWPVWPTSYQTPDTPEVARFAAEHAERVEWHMWLQWLVDEQLTAAKAHAQARGLAIGLYQDLAVGVDKSGAETWMHRDMYALDCRVGCPPDDFNLLGQDWGLPPWIPHKLRAAAYRPFIAMLRANMKYAGALRVDHVMGLMRLYWIPPGMKGDAGAYLAYPFADLLAILALESHRNQCVIVGEDLGTVPDEVRHALQERGVLTYRLFYFERQQDGHFMPPAWYPEQALVAASTHDLPTLAGYWRGRDIEVRTELGLFPSEAVRNNQIVSRSEDRVRLLADLAREGLLPEGMSTNPDDMPELPPALLRAVLRYVARTPSRIALVQAEDMLGQVEQANLPGTVDEHPNWRRKLRLELERWRDDADCQAVVACMAAERGKPV
jgi:4-alpha-glucanotransferase